MMAWALDMSAGQFLLAVPFIPNFTLIGHSLIIFALMLKLF